MTETRAGYQAGREERVMDTEIAEQVMGWTLLDTAYGDCWGRGLSLTIILCDAWKPSTNIADAMTVADKLIDDGWEFKLGKHPNNRQWVCSFEPIHENIYIAGKQDTREKAICSAALAVAEYLAEQKAS